MGKTASLANIGSIADSSLGFRNRLINSAMVIDQRNAGASITPTDGAYSLDRWQARLSQASKYTVEQTITGVSAPVGFTDYLGITSSSSYPVVSSDYFAIVQVIEGYNCADLAWGTANAKTVTLSFLVYSSLTGTFGGSIRNYAGTRSYPFTYTISSANTWTSISVTVAGDTTGSWPTTNSGCINVIFGLGVGSSLSGTAGAWAATNYFSATGATSVVGTNGATFYITGVQLEKGSTATSFDYRPYGTELALCQRYYQQYNGNAATFSSCFYRTTTSCEHSGIFLPVTMRTIPSVASTSGTNATLYTNGSATVPTAINFAATSGQFIYCDATTPAQAANSGGWLIFGTGNNLMITAEL